jgi:hypothetical protein
MNPLPKFHLVDWLQLRKVPMAKMTTVPSAEPDYTRCRAVVLSQGFNAQQCSRRPTQTRQDRDGKLYRVCRQHKQARYFIPWTPEWLMGRQDAVNSAFRKLQAYYGHKPPGPKLVR